MSKAKEQFLDQAVMQQSAIACPNPTYTEAKKPPSRPDFVLYFSTICDWLCASCSKWWPMHYFVCCPVTRSLCLSPKVFNTQNWMQKSKNGCHTRAKPYVLLPARAPGKSHARWSCPALHTAPPLELLSIQWVAPTTPLQRKQLNWERQKGNLFWSLTECRSLNKEIDSIARADHKKGHTVQISWTGSQS